MGRKGNSGFANPDVRFGNDSGGSYTGSLGFTQHYLERLDGDLAPDPGLAPADGFTVWVKASDGITLNGTSAVSGWADQSTNNIDFSQSTTSAQPTFTSASGTISASQQRLDDNILQINDQINRYDERLERRRIQLTNEFAKMQELMASLARQQSFMGQFFR